MLTLNSWGNAWFVHLLNPESGKHKLRLKKSSSNLNGFACYESTGWFSRRFYAVYGLNDKFIFQAGNKNWDLTEGIVEIDFVFLNRGKESNVLIKHNETLIHQAHLIHPLRNLISNLDPAFDQTDEEYMYFFIFLSKFMTKQQWRKYLISLSKNAA